MNIDPRLADQSLSRRAVVLHAGLAAAALTGLSACSADRPPVQSGTDPGGGAAITAKTADIPVGGGKVFVDRAANQHAVITQPTAGEFKAFSSICPHAQCDVSEVTTTINCAGCHQSAFSIADGSVVKPPATTGLSARTVTVEGDTLTVG